MAEVFPLHGRKRIKGLKKVDLDVFYDEGRGDYWIKPPKKDVLVKLGKIL